MRRVLSGAEELRSCLEENTFVERNKGREVSDYSNIVAVCFDCARNAGFTPNKKTGGAWVGECDICKSGEEEAK